MTQTSCVVRFISCRLSIPFVVSVKFTYNAGTKFTLKLSYTSNMERLISESGKICLLFEAMGANTLMGHTLV